MAAGPSSAAGRCPLCGSGLPAYARFCGSCGHTLSMRPPQPQPAGTAGAVPPPLPQPAHGGEVRLASRGVRCSASLLDFAAMLSPALPLSVAGAFLGVAEVVYIVLPVAFAAVWIWMQTWQGLTGASFGKSMLGLRLVRSADHRPPGFAATVTRSGIFLVTFGFIALPVLFSDQPRLGQHDECCRLTVLDVMNGANPLGPQPQRTLRPSAGRALNQVRSPIPATTPRHG
jgi:uncharacterized RDD family membrane protein YckC